MKSQLIILCVFVHLGWSIFLVNSRKWRSRALPKGILRAKQGCFNVTASYQIKKPGSTPGLSIFLFLRRFGALPAKRVNLITDFKNTRFVIVNMRVGPIETSNWNGKIQIVFFRYFRWNIAGSIYANLKFQGNICRHSTQNESAPWSVFVIQMRCERFLPAVIFFRFPIS